MSSNVSSSPDSFSTTFLHKASLTLTSFKFHHFINFLPIDFIFSLHAFPPPVYTPCCEVTASDGIVGAYLIVFAFPSMFFPSHQFHVIYLGFISTTSICYKVVCSLLEDCVWPVSSELICRCISSNFISSSFTAPIPWPPCNHLTLLPCSIFGHHCAPAML